MGESCLERHSTPFLGLKWYVAQEFQASVSRGNRLNCFLCDLLQDYFFDSKVLTDGELAPNDRCCRICGKIGHYMKDCPKRRRLSTFVPIAVVNSKKIRNTGGSWCLLFGLIWLLALLLAGGNKSCKMKYVWLYAPTFSPQSLFEAVSIIRSTKTQAH